ncbi:hypothetical protein K1T71_014129 [Dendrolimus kikuchii]|uniref:Uncharacterized protein n=1 Tax=Dendrolimus kikuchii TaxID=765133 RepID=A0ACC1CF64_9NEOP|nr:hypothetical protein K1T71_014129 [Dendrolimus kikuchii]
MAMASCSDDKGQIEEVSFTLEEKKADQSKLHDNPAKILNENIPALTDNSEEDKLDEYYKETIGDSILKLKENTNSTDIIEQITQDINNHDKMQLQSFDNGCNEFNNFDTNNKFLNKNEEMEQIYFNDIYNNIENDSYIDLDEFDKFINYNSNTDEVAYTINMTLDDIVKTIDIKHKKQDEASDNDLNTANYSDKNATIISNNDTLAVIKELTDDKNVQLNKTNLYKNDIKESDVIVGNINLCDNSEITNNKKNCAENTLNALTYQTEYTRPSNNVEFIDINKFDRNLGDANLFQDIVLDVETFSARDRENYENTTNINFMTESLSKVTAVEITHMQETKTRSLPGENMDCDKSSKIAPDDNSESLLQRKVDEETLNNNNIDDLLSVKDLGDYNLHILNRKNKSIQAVKNRADIKSDVKPKHFENIKYICDKNNIKKPSEVSLNNIESFTTKAVMTDNGNLNKNENKDDIYSKSFNNVTARYRTETKIPNNMINSPADSNKLESNNQTILYDSNIISTQENINKVNIVTPNQNQYSKSIKDNTNAQDDSKFDKNNHNNNNTDKVQNNLYTAPSTFHPVLNTINNTNSSGQNISKICIKSTKTLEGQRDIKNESNDTDSDYNSSDFEFISENEAKTDLLLDKTIDTSQYDISKTWNRNAYVYRLREAGNKYPGPTNYQKRHEVPRGEAYLRLFRENEYHPVLSNVHMMENKSIRSSQSNDQYRGVGFDMRLTRRENFDNGHERNAKATMKKIYSMHPADNKRRL